MLTQTVIIIRPTVQPFPSLSLSLLMQSIVLLVSTTIQILIIIILFENHKLRRKKCIETDTDAHKWSLMVVVGQKAINQILTENYYKLINACIRIISSWNRNFISVCIYANREKQETDWFRCICVLTTDKMIWNVLNSWHQIWRHSIK